MNNVNLVACFLFIHFRLKDLHVHENYPGHYAGPLLGTTPT